MSKKTKGQRKVLHRVPYHLAVDSNAVFSNIPGIIQRVFFTTSYTNRSQCHPIPSEWKGNFDRRNIPSFLPSVHPSVRPSVRPSVARQKFTRPCERGRRDNKEDRFVRLYRPRNPILSSFFLFSLSISHTHTHTHMSSLSSPPIPQSCIHTRTSQFCRGLVSESYRL